jgi:hypothetical protein
MNALVKGCTQRSSSTDTEVASTQARIAKASHLNIPPRKLPRWNLQPGVGAKRDFRRRMDTVPG